MEIFYTLLYSIVLYKIFLTFLLFESSCSIEIEYSVPFVIIMCSNIFVSDVRFLIGGPFLYISL